MDDRVLCPYCGEEIPSIARKCRHCGEYLDPEHPGADVVPRLRSANQWRSVVATVRKAISFHGMRASS